MYLAEIEIQGFKSFAERTRLTFTRDLAAIVGPNGSGKSNVADAIRWVLGEQSMKLLRGKRAEDVIFTGSASRARLSLAEVALRFDNSDGRAPVDGAELTIRRRVYRDGTGEYSINGQPVRLSDVLLLLARCSVGQRTYAVIGQGMTDAFLSVSPAERKVYFDEAAGIRQYQLKREQAVGKLDRTKENLAQAQLLVNEIEPRLRSLTRAVKRLERRETVEGELREHQQAYYGTLLHRLKAERSTADARTATAGRRVQDLEKTERDRNTKLAGLVGGGSELAGLEAELGAAQSARESLVREAARVAAERHAELASTGKGELAWLEQRLAGLTEERKRIAAEHTEAQTQTASAALRLSLAEKKLRDGSTVLETLRAELERSNEARGALPPERIGKNLERIMSEAAALVTALRSATDPAELPSLVVQAERFHAALTDLHRTVTDQARGNHAPDATVLQGKLLAVTDARESLLGEVTEARVRHAGTGSRAKSLASQEQRLNREVETLERQRQRAGDAAAAALQGKELETKLTAATDRVEGIQEKLRELAEREEGKRSDLTALQSELRTLQTELVRARAEQNAFAVERARLEQRTVDLEHELRDELPIDLARTVRENSSAANNIDTNAEAQTIARLKHQRDLIGGIDEGVAAEYRSTNERFQYLTHQIDDLGKALADLETAILELDSTIKKEFDVAFERITTLFQKYFRTLFGGGTAKLILLRELKPAEGEEPMEGEEDDALRELEKPKKPSKLERVVTGIEIQANPPGKRLKSVQQLSGGERALTSIGLLSAIIAHNPSPFVVLDEVDAALDEANSRRFAMILEELARKTQFIAITHNRATMEHAHLLYGVTMSDDGVSHILSVKLEEAEKALTKRK